MRQKVSVCPVPSSQQMALRRTRKENDLMIPQLRSFDQREEPGKLEANVRNQICRVGQWMYQRGLIVAGEGNLSVRLSAERILITPASACKGMLAPEDLLVVDPEGAILSEQGQPSSEMQMHLAFYRLRPDVQAVCHAHPPEATGFAAAGRALEEAVLPEVIVTLGKIPLAPYATPGTREVCLALEPLIPCHDAILLQNHGVVTCGPDLRTAYFRLETVEQFARIMLTAQALGGPHLLPRAEMQKLIPARARDGTLIAPAHELDLPHTAEELEGRITFTR
jgi:L-fuculose-phosphate aldolase